MVSINLLVHSVAKIEFVEIKLISKFWNVSNH